MYPPAPLQSGILGPETLPFLLVATGLALAIAETLAPGAHFIVVGIALLGAGLVGLLVPALAGPLVLAVLVVVFALLTLYGYRNVDLFGYDESGRTTDSSSLRGATGHVVSEVTPSGGRVRLDEGGFDPNYSARSVDGTIPEGAEVIVVDPGGGNVLTVEAVGGEDPIDRELRRDRERERDRGTAADADADREPERE